MYHHAILFAALGCISGLAVGLAGCSGSSGDGSAGNPPPDSPPPDDDPADDEPRTLTITDVRVGEADGVATFTVKLDASAADEVSVDYATTDGTATAGEDYQPASGTLTFPPGTVEQTLTVQIIDDSEPEGEETFNVELGNPVNAQIGEPVGAGTIVDDDDLDVCGAPDIDAATDSAAFLWKDCSLDVWHLRVTGGGQRAIYDGELNAADAFTSLTAVGTEDDDVVTQPSPTEIAFSLDVENDRDGFDFETTEDAGVCLELFVPAGGRVLVGPDRAALTTPLDIGSLAACENQPTPASYNIVVLFTDDQRFDTLQYMPALSARLTPRGVTFENAYVSTPLCCPARASLFSGGFLAQNTGVLTNDGPNGGMQAFDDSVNIGTRLQDAGYQTQFIGKWLNDYIRFSPYIPPGWDHFAGRAEWETLRDWYNFRYGTGSTRESPTQGSEVRSNGQYHVNYERDQILHFIGQASPNQPFFVLWSTTPPHAPFIPDAQDEDAFTDFTYRERGFGETDLSDKPSYVRNDPGMADGDDEDVRNQLRSMLSVDRGLDAIMDAIVAQGKLDETVFIVTSDNGYMWGEHGLWAKNKPYEESIRVPMLVVMPGIAPRSDESLVYALLDLGATLFDIAGISGDSDGTSLLPLLEDPGVAWRNELFFEKHATARSMHGLWMGLRQDNWKYVEYANGEAELYDLEADPFELENRADDPMHHDLRVRLANRTGELVGLSIKPVLRNTDGRVGEHYLLALQTWGGEPPLEWKLESGRLPPGVSLDSATGEISGTPSAAGSWTFAVRVTGSELARQKQTPMTYVTGDIAITIR